MMGDDDNAMNYFLPARVAAFPLARTQRLACPFYAPVAELGRVDQPRAAARDIKGVLGRQIDVAAGQSNPVQAQRGQH